MQNDLLFNGKKYISVNRASKEIGYSQDYIGQLCRKNVVPAKLIGRTWYVDIDLLTKYKNSAKSKNEKRIENVDNKEVLVYPRQTNDKNLFKYENEIAPVLPLLKNKKLKKDHSMDLVRNPVVLSATFLVSLFIVGNIAFSWLGFLAPRQAELVNLKISLVSETVIEGFKDLEESVHLALVASTTNNESASTSEGIVVFPDSADREDIISRIKNSFSDEVEILMDEDGGSGVIRPVFKSSGESDDYAFVLVPIESKI
ncbi:MAG: hypothetical protein ACYCY6_03150 [Minisyncoccota bacterium]